MTWNSNDGALSSDDWESCWWLLVNWWVRMMTWKNDGHISPEWCPWVMSRTLGEMMKTCCKRWLQNALISYCFRKVRLKLCKQIIKHCTDILITFRTCIFAAAKFLHLFSFHKHLDSNRSCAPHKLKLRRSFISLWLKKKEIMLPCWYSNDFEKIQQIWFNSNYCRWKKAHTDVEKIMLSN